MKKPIETRCSMSVSSTEENVDVLKAFKICGQHVKFIGLISHFFYFSFYFQVFDRDYYTKLEMEGKLDEYGRPTKDKVNICNCKGNFIDPKWIN